MLAALGLVASGLQASGATTRGCATRPLPGGEWSSYGGNLAQTNVQPAERTIGPGNVANLSLLWSATANAGQSTPVVAGSCVYVIGGGVLTALDVMTGRTMWTIPVAPTCGASLGSYCPQAPHVVNGRVHVHSSEGGKVSASAFDARTGEPLWRSRPLSWGYNVDQLASARWRAV